MRKWEQFEIPPSHTTDRLWESSQPTNSLQRSNSRDLYAQNQVNPLVMWVGMFYAQCLGHRQGTMAQLEGELPSQCHSLCRTKSSLLGTTDRGTSSAVGSLRDGQESELARPSPGTSTGARHTENISTAPGTSSRAPRARPARTLQAMGLALTSDSHCWPTVRPQGSCTPTPSPFLHPQGGQARLSFTGVVRSA